MPRLGLFLAFLTTRICACHYVEYVARVNGIQKDSARIGSLGDIGAFSFDHAKALTTGEGGMLTFSNRNLYMRARAWHDHGHEGRDPMVWLDGLDIPQVQFFGSTFGEGYDADVFETTLPPGTNQARFGANVRAVDDLPEKPFSPLFTYPFNETNQALEKLIQSREPNPWHGYKMEYQNSRTANGKKKKKEE